MALACERAAPAVAAREPRRSILVPRGTWRYRDPGRLLADALRRRRPHRDRRVRHPAADARDARVHARSRAVSSTSRWSSAARRSTATSARRSRARARPRPSRSASTPDERARPRRRDHPADRDRRRPHDPGRAVRGDRDRVARRARRDGGDARASSSPSCGRGSATSPPPNPDAWRRDAIAPEFLSSPVGPRTRCTRRRTRSGTARSGTSTRPSAFVVCSAEAADALGVAARRAGCSRSAAVESNAMVPLVATRRAAPLARRSRAAASSWPRCRGVDPRDADHLDLYSCFPSAVQVQAEELGLGPDRPLTVTGGMTFAGGPLDNYNFQALAKMVEVLREHPGTTGLVTCISGMITKHGMALWSTTSARRRLPLRRRVRRDARAHRGARPRAGPRRSRRASTGTPCVHSRAGEPERAIVVATTRGRPSLRRRQHRHRPRRRHGRARSGAARDVHVTGSTFH